jgi:hypothetical protein
MRRSTIGRQELAQRRDGSIARGRVNEFDGQEQRHNDSSVAREECICANLSKTDADRASPQSLLGITRPPAGILQSLHDYTKEDSHHDQIRLNE